MSGEAAEATFGWLLKGIRRGHILEAIAKKFPDASPEETYAAAYARVEALAGESPAFRYAWSLARLEALSQKQEDIGDYAGAMASVKAIVAALRAKHEILGGIKVEQEEDETWA